MQSGKAWRVSVMTAVIASASVCVPAAMAQSTPSNADLAHLVKQQAAQIQRLNARLDQLETPDNQQNQPASSSMNSTAAASDQVLEQRVSKIENDHVKVDWSGGAPTFYSPDGDYTFAVGGRMQYDFSSTSGSRYGDNPSRNITGSEFRRARLGVGGKVAGWLLYKLEADFAGGSAKLNDAYLATKKNFELGEGIVYLGRKLADRGLSGSTSTQWTWFTERNIVANSIQPASGTYATGITAAFYGNNDWHASLALSKGSTSSSNKSSNNLAIFSRAHWNPIATNHLILHVGVNGFYENFNDARTSDAYSNKVSIGGHYNGNLRIRSGAINPSDDVAYGLELAGLAGPFAVGVEYGHRTLAGRHGADDRSYDAYSGQIGYTLTGGEFGYSTKKGAWTRPKIPYPVLQGGLGVWELVARYNAIDFENSASYSGGTGHGTTLGLNWYLNKYARLLFDYTHWRTNNRTGAFALPDDGNSINTRVQIVW